MKQLKVWVQSDGLSCRLIERVNKNMCFDFFYSFRRPYTSTPISRGRNSELIDYSDLLVNSEKPLQSSPFRYA